MKHRTDAYTPKSSLIAPETVMGTRGGDSHYTSKGRSTRPINLVWIAFSTSDRVFASVGQKGRCPRPILSGIGFSTPDWMIASVFNSSFPTGFRAVCWGVYITANLTPRRQKVTCTCDIWWVSMLRSFRWGKREHKSRVSVTCWCRVQLGLSDRSWCYCNMRTRCCFRYCFTSQVLVLL